MNAEFLAIKKPVHLTYRGTEHSSKQAEVVHFGVISMYYAGKIFFAYLKYISSPSLADI